MAAAKRKATKRKPDPKPEPEYINPGGRPRKIQNIEQATAQLRALGQIGCPIRECAAVLGVTEVTLYKFFRDFPETREAYDEAIDTGRAALRRRQVATAMRDGPGSVTMQIWLGKNWLNQKEPAPASADSGMQNIDALELMFEEIDKRERRDDDQQYDRAMKLIEQRSEK